MVEIEKQALIQILGINTNKKRQESCRTVVDERTIAKSTKNKYNIKETRNT